MTEGQSETRNFDAGHLGIELPGVEVHEVVSVTRDGPPHEPAEEGTWIEAEIAPSGDRQLETSKMLHGECELGYLPVRSVHTRAERRAEIVESAVSTMKRERMQAGIVSVAALGQDRKVFVVDAEGRCAITDDGLSSDVLEKFSRADDVVAEFQVRELRREDMPMTVRGDLVPARCDPTHQRRFSLRHPVEDEERSTYLCLIEEIENHLGGADDASRDIISAFTWKDASKVFYLEPILDIEGQQARQRSRHYIPF